MSRFRASALFAAFCLLTTGRAHADYVPYPYFFYTDATYTDETSPIPNADGDVYTAIVGYTSADTDDDGFMGPVTISQTYGTQATWQNDMDVFNGSTVNVNGGDPTHPGGAILGTLTLNDTSLATVSAKGFVNELSAVGQSTVTVSGGTIGSIDGSGNVHGGLDVSDSCTVTIDGGTVNQMNVEGGNTTISGGTVNGILQAYFAGTTVNVSNGIISTAGIQQGAAMEIDGGTFLSDVYANNTGSISMNAGTVMGTFGTQYGTAILGGGTVGGMYCSGTTGQEVMTDGLVKGPVTATLGSLINIFGGAITSDVSANTQSTIGLSSVSIVGSAVENGSTLNIFDGVTIGGNVVANDGELNMDGGNAAGLLVATGAAHVTMTGGNIAGALQSSNSAIVFVNGGSVAGVCSSSNSSQLTMSAGTTGAMGAYDNSILTMTGGNDQGGLDAYNTSTVFVSGGATIQGALSGHTVSTVFITGGSIYGGVNAYDSSVITFSGGSIFGGLNAVSVYNDARFVWSGGTITSGGNTPNNNANSGGGANGRPLTNADSTELPIYVNDNGSLEIDGINVGASLLSANTNGGAYSEYQLSGYFGDGTPVPAGADFFVQNPAGGVAGANFKVAATAQTWNANTGSWSNPANWSPNIIADGVGSNANFSTATAAATVDLDGDRTVGTLTLGGSNSYTIDSGTGGTLYLNNNGAGASILVTGQHQILAPIVTEDNTTIDVESTLTNGTFANSSLTLAGGITSFGHALTIVERGGVPLSAAYVNGSEVDIDNGTLRLMPDSMPASNSSVVEDLSIGSQGKLDITNNFFSVYYGPNADPIATIQAYLARGQIYSSTVDSDNASQSSLIYAIGYTDGNDGQGFTSPGEIDLLPTLAGDAELYGDVVFGDFQILAANFGQPGAWDQGNFTGGNTINFGDFQLLAQNFGADFNGLTASELASLNSFALIGGEKMVENGDGVGYSLVAVPEPATIIFAGAALLFRRRKRSGSLSTYSGRGLE